MNEGDRDRVLQWRNSDHVRENMYSRHEISAQEHAAWLERVLADPRYAYFIFEHSDVPTGLVGFFDINSESGNGTWAFYVGPQSAPQGIGAVMEYLALEWAFNELELKTLRCEVLEFNKRTIKLHRRFGFSEESVIRGRIERNGEPQDSVVLTMSDRDWSANRDKLERIVFSKDRLNRKSDLK